jgi:hypothetical protein
MENKCYTFPDLVQWCAFMALRASGDIDVDSLNAYFAGNTFNHVMVTPDDPANPTVDDITLAVDAVVNQVWTWHQAETRPAETRATV